MTGITPSTLVTMPRVKSALCMCDSSILKPAMESRSKEAAMDWPKRARTAAWESGILTLNGEIKIEISELTMDLMEQLAGYTLVGFYEMCIRDRTWKIHLKTRFRAAGATVNPRSLPVPTRKCLPVLFDGNRGTVSNLHIRKI